MNESFGFHGSSRIRTLNNLIAYIITESLKEPMCNKHIHLAKSMKKGDIIWNFNYDLLMDNALYFQQKFSDTGYIMRFDYTYIDDNWERLTDVPSDIIMLKLHGSLNWLKCTTCGCNLLLRNKKAIPELWTGIQELYMRCPKCNSSEYLGLERIIVPPSLVKSYGDIEVRYLWKYAQSIKDIDQLVVIGYRFAKEDSEVEMLLRTLFQNGNIKSDIPIHIVNPKSEEVLNRLKSIFIKSEITYELPDSFFSKIISDNQ